MAKLDSNPMIFFLILLTRIYRNLNKMSDFTKKISMEKALLHPLKKNFIWGMNAIYV